MTKFKVDNLPLTARTDTPEDVAHITVALAMLNSSVALCQSESAARMKELVDKLDASNFEVAQLRMQVTSLKSLLSTRGMKSPVRSLKSPVVRKSPSDVGDSDVAGEVQGASATAATNLNAFCDSEIDVGDTAGDSASATAQSSAQSGHRFSVQAGILGMGGAAPRPVLSVNALAFSGDSTPNYSLDNKKAIEFYEDARVAFPRMSKQDEARGRVCMRLLKGCATQEEKSWLATKETAGIIVSKTLRLLQDRFIRRLLDEYAAAGLAGPRDLVAFKDLTVSSVENRVSTLERKAKGSKLRMFNSLSAAEINQLAPRPESHQLAMNTLKRKA